MLNKIFKNDKYIPADVLCIGVDIAKKFHYAQLTAGGGKYLTRKALKFSNDLCGFSRFSGWLNELKTESGYSDVCVGMEPTGPYWRCFFDYLERNGIRVVLVSPLLVKKMKDVYDNSRCKTDSKDAQVIARMVSEGKYLSRATLTDEQETLRHFVDSYNDLSVKKTACTNAIGSSLAEYFPELENIFSSLESATLIELLKNCPLPCDVLDMGEDELLKLVRNKSNNRLGKNTVVKLIESARHSTGRQSGCDGYREKILCLAEELEGILTRLSRVSGKIKECLDKMEIYHYLRTIPGVGYLTIANVISAAGDLGNYRNAQCLLKQLGLQLYEVSSGFHKGRSHISKRGLSFARSCLYMASMVACKSGGIYHERSESMKLRGKAVPVIYVSISCKLLRLMYALVRDKREYIDDYNGSRAVRKVSEPWRKAA